MNLSERDSRVLWHPFTQAKTEGLPIGIESARGTKLYTTEGKELIDAVSSWWVNTHGHAHPHIASRIKEQVDRLEHVIFAGFTHEPAIELAERLLQRLPPNQSRIFYSDNGSTAVETALKIAMQYLLQSGQSNRGIVSLRNAYHGDTFGSMSTNERVSFYAPFEPYLFDVFQIAAPQSSEDDTISEFEALAASGRVGIFLFEPLLQGVAGMKVYSSEGLDRLLAICAKHGVVTIADEVMTGFGRTGRFLASDYCQHKADLYCLSKGITGGFMPLGATSATEEIFRAFYHSDRSKMLFHGHSYTGNALACAAALGSLDLFDRSETWNSIGRIEQNHQTFAAVLASKPAVRDVRVLGTMLRFEVQTTEGTGYLNSIRDFLYEQFVQRGVLLRPLGNVIYVLPPYCITDEELASVYTAIEDVLEILPGCSPK